MNYFITGASSGLGQFLLGKMDAEAVDNRQGYSFRKSPDSNVIHCGFSYPPTSNTRAAFDHITTAGKLTRQLIEQSSGKFVLMSSIDVYPKDAVRVYTEADHIDLREITGINGLAKYHAEQLVREMTDNHLIIRLGMLFGRHARPGLVKRIWSQECVTSPLDSSSTFAITNHQTVYDLLISAISKDFVGTLNLAGMPPLTLSAIATLAGNTRVEFGNRLYISPQVALTAATEILGYRPLSSVEALQEGWG